MNSDELTALSQTHNVISNSPPLLVGVGAEEGEMTARRLYIIS